MRKLYGRSIHGALLLVVFGGLAVPAMVGGYFLIGVQEREATARTLNDALQRNADILALGIQESLWDMNLDAARSLVDSFMRDPAVVHIEVRGLSQLEVINRRALLPPGTRAYRAERDIVVRGQAIGHVAIEMGDYYYQQALRAKQRNYVLVLAIQLGVSLLLIGLLIRRRLLSPLRTLTGFSDRLARGDFDTPLALQADDELGRLGGQMEGMRMAIGQLFADIARREEQFRTIVTQVPGAVFRARPGGHIDFVSDAIEEISGFPAERFMLATTDDWSNIIHPEDRRMQRHVAKDALVSGIPYEVEYRIVDAGGIERWVLESGQPQGEWGSPDFRVDGIIYDISERKHDEMRIEALLNEQGAILDNVMFGVLFIRERRIVSANRRGEELFGYGDGEMAGSSTEILFPTRAAFERLWAERYPKIAAGPDTGEELQLRRRDGSLIWLLVSGCALDAARPHEGSIWVFADITERKLAEEKLRLSATVLEHIADGVMVLDVGGRIVATNPAFTQITGYTEIEAVGQHSSLTRATLRDEAQSQGLWRDLLDAGFWRGELWETRKNGEVYLESLTVSAVRDDDDAVTHYVCVFSDITKVKESQDKLDHLAHHDPLTALPNRLLFHDRLQHAMVRAARETAQLAVLFIDLDRFKNVNDTLGHHVGDELLKQVAAALAGCLREDDTLARLGGDEFIVLLEGVNGASGTAHVADKLVKLFEQPFTVSGYELFVTGSVGVSLFPQDATDLNMLVRNADVAMYQAKARGRNGYQFYAASMSGEGLERLRLEALLRRAIEKNEIYLHYQPQVDIATRQLIGVEALVRWHNPELGQVAPVRFIPVAEDTGFISQLGQWVLAEACRQMICWDTAGLRVPKMAVNLSVRQFERGSIAPMVASVLQEAGLEAQRLQLEVTESVIMNTGDALGYVNDLRAVGVGLAIDDFGTGYSSLAYLSQLPVQTLKIDRSFIQDISTDANDEAIAVAIIQLGKSLNLSVVAEGVENEEQAAFLLRHGCRHAQGYLYSRPVAPDDLLAQWGQGHDEHEAGTTVPG
ncbi:PAS domain S-box-containing protein/diguanylate cyclase (GGDEF) domain-containing protein [Massilia yuzhufengensis]|uniref:PAS domain S-box-containing protein/diguanylate cyclase (GGDEF) domain-containing protein n=1 Tax=Massilia yuzhufengensis TaxID=1164594 RepID=A0A1I1EIZ9_9BURK|nr:PAS domain S-box-containing protein/diguanylate cyclase (GGDEF) domain-containing protein [Massilia yuzhufengensis]